MNFPFQIILGSKSPRRFQLLKEAGLKVEIFNFTIEESFPDSMSLNAVPEYLAQKKAGACDYILNQNQILLCADTIVIFNNEILGKPASKIEGKKILKRLSGKWHKVITGVCLKSTNKTVTFSETTEVKFSELTSSEIDFYLDTYKPYDKAGSYGIQEWIGLIGIEYIRGSYSNVVGLPIQQVYQNLKTFI